MKKIVKLRGLALIFSFTLALAIIMIELNMNKYDTTFISQNKDISVLNISSYWNLTGMPIDIDNSNPTNNWEYTALTYDWCTGSGIWSDPYIIEDVLIDGLGVGNCINISNSNVYFIIRNCTFYNSGTGSSFPHYAGIKLNNVNNGILINNNCSINMGSGIILVDCENIEIVDNVINKNGANGIILYNNCEQNTISRNMITGGSLSIGIYLYSKGTGTLIFGFLTVVALTTTFKYFYLHNINYSIFLYQNTYII